MLWTPTHCDRIGGIENGEPSSVMSEGRVAPAVRGVPENRPRIRVSVLSRQRSDQKSLELRIPCVGYLIARGLGAPDADDDRRLSPERRAPAIRTLSRSRFNCARRLTSSMLVSRRTARLQTLLLTVTPL